ncbi:hypothetical protein [Nocardia xishanensis]|uniref:Uncharacterized protein n=1 Tax=Nocardia xishanensis TaxID=238964 RepID=A0ABW7XBD0_9NOCA
MGYDTSFHALDMRLVEERILPYLAGLGGDGDLDDLIATAVEQARVRFRAKAWALGAMKAAADEFDESLHVWGRPYLITAETPAEVAETVVRYRDCTVGTVDELARAQLDLLDPALAARTEPDMSGTLPGADDLAIDIAWKIRLLRQAALALRSGQPTVDDPHSAETHDAADLLRNNVQFCLVEFAARLLPGWMDRGVVWPTALAEEAGTGWPTGFGGNGSLLGDLPTLFPEIAWRTEDTIAANYAVGGFVGPGDAAAARDWLATHAEALSGGDDRTRLSLRKCDEALALADLIGGGFTEATEIYSGMEGRIN